MGSSNRYFSRHLKTTIHLRRGITITQQAELCVNTGRSEQQRRLWVPPEGVSHGAGLDCSNSSAVGHPSPARKGNFCPRELLIIVHVPVSLKAEAVIFPVLCALPRNHEHASSSQPQHRRRWLFRAHSHVHCWPCIPSAYQPQC